MDRFGFGLVSLDLDRFLFGFGLVFVGFGSVLTGCWTSDLDVGFWFFFGFWILVSGFRLSSGVLHILVHTAKENVTRKESILQIFFQITDYQLLLYLIMSRSRVDILRTTSWYKWLLLPFILSSRGSASFASPRPSQLIAR
jgi:hypothetical protein